MSAAREEVIEKNGGLLGLCTAREFTDSTGDPDKGCSYAVIPLSRIGERGAGARVMLPR